MEGYRLKRKSEYRKLFVGSAALFDSCWRKLSREILPHVSCTSDDEVLEWLDSIAAEKVNNSGSRFFIYG